MKLILPATRIQFRTIARSPFVTSGVRLGTPAVTTRGMVEEDMDVIAEGIALVIKSEDNIEKVREMVKGLTDKYPLI